MESLNKVELVGFVGNVRTDKTGESVLHRFSVATSYTYRDRYGNQVIETTWHNCSYFSKEEDKRIKKGANLRCYGRIRMRRYTSADGIETLICDILVNRIESV